MSDPRAHVVKSAQRVLEVLEYFDGDNVSATVTDISRVLSYPQSSTSVLLRCLRDLGYLYYNRAERKYRLTTKAALIGCWAEGGVYRGGKMLRLVDTVCEHLGETVVLSNACADYAVHHLHVLRGANPGSVALRAGRIEPVLHSVQGELVLSSYPDPQIRLALHRLNADEVDPERRVSVAAKVAELQEVRSRGSWNIGYQAGEEPLGIVAMMMPRCKGGDRVVLSVVASEETVRANGAAFLEVVTRERDRIFPDFAGDAQRRSGSNVITMKAARADLVVDPQARREARWYAPDDFGEWQAAQR